MGIEDEVATIFRAEALDLLQRASRAVTRAADGDEATRAKSLGELKRVLHTLKGAAAAAGNEEVKDWTHSIEDRLGRMPTKGPDADFVPLLEELDGIETLLTSGARDMVEGSSLSPTLSAAPFDPSVGRSAAPPSAPEPVEEPPRPLAASPANDGHELAFAEWLRVSPERVDQLHAQVGELVLTRLRQDDVLQRLLSLHGAGQLTAARQRELGRIVSELRRQLPEEGLVKLKASVDRLGASIQGLVGELGLLRREARSVQAQSEVVGQAVETGIEELRLMPLGPFFEGFGKTVRDAARREGKTVRYVVEAQGAEVDRAVLVRLNDALLHLVRNAVVHGIEPPDARVRAGKPEQGTIRIEASTQGSRVEVRVSDDGAGVSSEQVTAKARRLGLSDSGDLLELLAQPGFSIRDSADDLAGRGVGLDVVMGIVRGLDGTMELTTSPGRGSLFTLRVPVAASITMGLVVEVAQRPYAFLLSNVERVLRPGVEEIERVEGKLMVRVDDELVSCAALSDLLGVQEVLTEAPARVPIVVLRSGSRRIGVAVAEVPYEHPLVVRGLGPAFARAELFVGGAIQPDQRIVPVLSARALFQRAAGHGEHRGLIRHEARAKEKLSALVVDDSMTTRSMLRNVLTAHGYEVTTAEDGTDALRVLGRMRECHVIITDLQMPLMDGIELCQSIRALDRPYVPIIMVTSVDDDQEKSRALAAGADAYVVKGRFEQGAFLHRVNTLVRGPAAA